MIKGKEVRCAIEPIYTIVERLTRKIGCWNDREFPVPNKKVVDTTYWIRLAA